MGASDILILEDEVQRIDLIGNVDITKAVTGKAIVLLFRFKKFQDPSSSLNFFYFFNY